MLTTVKLGLLALAYPDRIAKARGVEGYQLAGTATGVAGSRRCLSQTP